MRISIMFKINLQNDKPPILKTVGGVTWTKGVPLWQHPARQLAIYNISITRLFLRKITVKIKIVQMQDFGVGCIVIFFQLYFK